MITKNKLFAVLSVATALLCFVTAGKDLAYAVRNVLKTNYFMAFLDAVFAIWLFYWGYRNSRNAITLIKEWIYEG